MVTAVITGASSGLGKEYINAIIAEYPTVVGFCLVSRRKELLKEIADELSKRNEIEARKLELLKQIEKNLSDKDKE